MSNILNHNRLPFKCKLSYKDYWDFHLHLGREYGTVLPGLQTECLATFIDVTNSDCVQRTGLRSLVAWDDAKTKNISLENFGLTGVDNGRVLFDKDIITDEEFMELFEHFTLMLNVKNTRLLLVPVDGNLHRYTYGYKYEEGNCGRQLKLYGGFFQNFTRIGDGCEYSILPTSIGNGLSLEFELCRKDLDEYVEETTLNGAHPKNKGIFFYWGTRAENKWVRYYGELCNEEEPDETTLETVDGMPLDTPTSNPVESDNKFLTYSRTCGGHTVLDDVEGEPDPTVLIKAENVVLPDNPFTIFSRTCGGTTVLNFDEYLKEHAERYNIYSDLWRNAIAFQVTDAGEVGYKYLVKDCEANDPECSYKIESCFSNPGVVPYGEWVNIHVRILPCGYDKMRLMFYVDGRLVLYSKELPSLNFRELADSSDKQEGVPFNISLGGGTQGLAETVYEDWRTYDALPQFPLETEFGGTFIGYIKSFKFYSCSLNYEQINQNVQKEIKACDDSKIYCGALVFNEKPSKTPVTEQGELITLLNEYNQDTRTIKIRLLPNITKRYLRLVVATPESCNIELKKAIDTMNGMTTEESNGKEITDQFTYTSMPLIGREEKYNVWHYTYATRPRYNNTIIIELKENE